MVVAHHRHLRGEVVRGTAAAAHAATQLGACLHRHSHLRHTHASVQVALHDALAGVRSLRNQSLLTKVANGLALDCTATAAQELYSPVQEAVDTTSAACL